MKLQEVSSSGSGPVIIEFSVEEFMTLTGIVYTLDQFFDMIDSVPYDLNHKEVSTFAVELGAIQKTLLVFANKSRLESAEQAATAKGLIVTIPEKLNGKAFILGTKLPVWGIVSYLKGGQSKQEILEGFPSLTIELLDAAIAYYEMHTEEIDRDLAEAQE